MPVCDRCGEEIEFRYIDGRRTPIHFGGGWCQGSKIGIRNKRRRPFTSVESYTDPNAVCPVCGASVFFYQNVHGSRVFFDDLGWPWPKHPCTDSPAAQSGHIKQPKRAKSRPRGRVSSLAIYERVRITDDGPTLRFKFRNVQNPLLVRTLRIASADLQSQNWTLDDLKEAPSFVLKTYSNATTAEFISVRKRCIGRIVFATDTPQGNDSSAIS